MQQMVTDQTRRRLLKAALFGASAPFLPFGCASTSSQQKTPALIGCSILGRDKFFATVADINGNPIHQLTLPARGHGVAIHHAGSAAVASLPQTGDIFPTV